MLGPVVLLVGLAAAVAVRCAVGGAEVARSRPAGLLFALLLAALTLVAPRARGAARQADRPVRRLAVGLVAGVLGAGVLCIPALVAAAGTYDAGTSTTGSVDPLGGGARPGFLGWAAVVLVVATAEEAFLRGALTRLLEPFGTLTAVAVPAVAFAALHVPLYGWGAAPLDLAVGVWLGALRAATGTWAAPAVAHVLADWAAWALT